MMNLRRLKVFFILIALMHCQNAQAGQPALNNKALLKLMINYEKRSPKYIAQNICITNNTKAKMNKVRQTTQPIFTLGNMYFTTNAQEKPKLSKYNRGMQAAIRNIKAIDAQSKNLANALTYSKIKSAPTAMLQWQMPLQQAAYNKKYT